MRLSGLDVPILVQAYPDDVTAFNLERRRDAFCGKISVCSDLRQYGFAYTLTERHTVPVASAEFRADLDAFVRVCKVANGMRTGAPRAPSARGRTPSRPCATARSCSRRPASRSASSTSPRSSAGPASSATTMPGSRPSSTRSRPTSHSPSAPPDRVVQMARLGVVIDDWMAENDLDASAIQCWHSLQENFGVNVCTLMSMMSNKMMPSACETDITGLASMYALQLASGEPAAIVDLNNNYGDDPDKCVLFHCGNWPLNFYTDAEMTTAEVLGTTLGADNVWGAIDGRAPDRAADDRAHQHRRRQRHVQGLRRRGSLPRRPARHLRVQGRGRDPRLPATAQVHLQGGLRAPLRHEPVHDTADAVAEALGTYLKWEVYRHE